MTTSTFILLSLCLTVAAQQTYQLVWSDEFNGNSLDLSKWQYEINCDGGGNNELQCYTNNPGNLQVANGTLSITALAQNYNGKQFTSARINTRASAAWKFGKIEFRAKMPYGKYMWPALWMMPRDGVYGGGWWAASGEIDIMEHRGTTNQVESTLHYGGGWPNNVYSGSGPRTMAFDSAADYHLYSAVWTPDSIDFLIDNNVYYSENLNRNFWSGRGTNPYTSTRQPFDQNFYIIINMALGGGFFGSEANSLTWDIAKGWTNPTFNVDYVRVYQLQDSPVNVNPLPVAPTTSSSCSAMFASLQCRTRSEDPSQVDSNAATGALNWLCGYNGGVYCKDINTGGAYSGCNSVEKLSQAMNAYYQVYGPSQGASACNFGGVGTIVASAASTATPTTAASTSSTTPKTSSTSSTAAPSTSSTTSPKTSSTTSLPKTSSTTTPTTSTPSAPVTTAQPSACPNGCGGGSCCNDGRIGGVCYSTASSSCLLDTDGKSYLCGAGAGVCSTHCFDASRYICVNGGLQQKY